MMDLQWKSKKCNFKHFWMKNDWTTQSAMKRVRSFDLSNLTQLNLHVRTYVPSHLTTVIPSQPTDWFRVRCNILVRIYPRNYPKVTKSEYTDVWIEYIPGAAFCSLASDPFLFLTARSFSLSLRIFLDYTYAYDWSLPSAYVVRTYLAACPFPLPRFRDWKIRLSFPQFKRDHRCTELACPGREEDSLKVWDMHAHVERKYYLRQIAPELWTPMHGGTGQKRSCGGVVL